MNTVRQLEQYIMGGRKDAYTTEDVQKALAGITGDTKGTSWQPIEVKLEGAKP